MTGEIPQSHPSPRGHSQRVESQGRKGKSSLVARDREKLERRDEDGSRVRSVGSQKEWGAVRAVQSHVGNREDFLGCNTPPLHPLTAGRSKPWRKIHGQENPALTESGAKLNATRA